MRRTKGFTLIELLVVIGIIALLVSILVPTLGRVRELARQAVCASNLNGIGKAIAVYSTGSGSGGSGGYPIASQYATEAVSNGTTLGTGFVDAVTMMKNNLTGVPAMQNVWLLIAGNYIGPDMFRCQSDTTSGRWAASGTNTCGFNNVNQFSYGITFPYDGIDATAAGTCGSKLSDDNLNPGLVMMADRSPYKAAGDSSAFKAPVNHSSDGFTVLVKGLSVSFYKSVLDSNAGFGGDDVYTGGGAASGANRAGTAGGMPKAANSTSANPVVTPWDTSICLSPR